MKKIKDYLVTVDYNQTVGQAIDAGKYDFPKKGSVCYNYFLNCSDSQAKQGIESTQKKNKVITQISLIPIPPPSGRSYITTRKAKDALNELGYRPANLYELLILGAQYPDLQRQLRIVGLGSSCAYPRGDRSVPCLDRDGSERGLDLYWTAYAWGGSWRFAAVRKIN